MKFQKFLLALIVSLAFVATVVFSQETATAPVEAEPAAESATTESADASAPIDEDIPVEESSSTMDLDAEEADAVVEDEPAAEEAVTEAEADTTEATAESTSTAEETEAEEAAEPVQTGPLIDLLGPQLLSLQMVDETSAQISPHYTNEALAGKNVIGLYFSADWCGPCRQFTPELVSFYEKINNRRGKKDQFQIVWISRCRDVQSYANYFAHMPWLALPPEEAMGARGQMLGEKYGVKGIPSLVLIDDLGQTITTDARNKVPQDKAGIGFPWRNPFSQLVSTIFPRSLRLLVKTQIDTVKVKIGQKVKTMIGLNKKAAV